MANSRRSISAIAAVLLFAALGSAQCEFVDPPPPVDPGGSGQQGGLLYESRNGWYLPTSGTLRILLVLVEVDNVAGTTDWPAHQLPFWVNNPDPNLNLFDWNVPSGTATGLLTRYFQDASSGHFNVVADYLLAPDNGGIFHASAASNPLAIAAVNAALGTTIVTGHGFTSVTDFDK